MEIWNLGQWSNIWCVTGHGNGNYWTSSIASQLDCQDICLKNPSCIGISYSYRSGMSNICFLCTTVPLNDFDRNSFGFAFYRAPGKVFLLSNAKYWYLNNSLVYLILIVSCSQIVMQMMIAMELQTHVYQITVTADQM